MAKETSKEEKYGIQNLQHNEGLQLHIHKMRNKLSPIFNYFHMEDKLKDAADVNEIEHIQNLIHKEGKVCVEQLPIIKELLIEAAQQTAALQAECNRYREALKEIANMKPFLGGLARNMNDIAKEAIGQQTADEALRG